MLILLTATACSKLLEFADWTIPVPEGTRVVEYAATPVEREFRAHRALVGDADDFEVREHDLAGTLVRRIRWRRRELALDPAEIDRYKRWVTETQELDPQGFWAQELIKMEFPATMPAYVAMLLDDRGDLWVQRFARPGIREEDWDVFSPDAVWRGTVEVPHSLAVTGIGDNYLLGIYQDELGTEFVRLHRLVRPKLR